MVRAGGEALCAREDNHTADHRQCNTHADGYVLKEPQPVEKAHAGADIFQPEGSVTSGEGHY